MKQLKEGTFNIRKIFLYYGSLIVLGIIFMIFSIIAPNFLSVKNVLTILGQVAIIGVMAFGITFVLILGGLDMSVMGLPGFIGSLVAFLITTGKSIPVAIAIGLLTGMAMGFLNGIVATKLKVGILLSGLAFSWIARGMDLWISNYGPIYIPQKHPFLLLGQGNIGGIPISFIVCLLAFIALNLVMTKTSFGRNFYAIGGSEEGAKACGINIDKYKIIGLTLSGLMAALGGIMLTSKAGASMPNAAEGLWFDVFLSALFGSTVMTGGIPHIAGTGAGVIFTGILLNGFTQFNVHEFDQMVIKGGCIILAVAISAVGGKILKIDMK